MSRRCPSLPSVFELDRAIFLDFEGFKSGPPLMASVRMEGVTSTVVFSDQSPQLAIAAEATGVRVETLTEFLLRISEQAERTHRRIAAYSARELKVFQSEGVNAAVVEALYLDVRKIVLWWRSLRHPEVADREERKRARRRARGLWHDPSGNSLLAIAKLAGLESSSCYGQGRTTSRLKAVADQIALRDSHELLTPIAKSKWTNLIKHNRWDCEACERLLTIAVWDLASR